MVLSAVYYTIYTEDGPIRAENPINLDVDDSPSVARIDNNLVPPSHTLNSAIRRISQAGSFLYNFWHRVFVDITSESPMEDKSVLILDSGGPGPIPERLLTFLRSAEMTKRLKVKNMGL